MTLCFTVISEHVTGNSSLGCTVGLTHNKLIVMSFLFLMYLWFCLRGWFFSLLPTPKYSLNLLMLTDLRLRAAEKKKASENAFLYSNSLYFTIIRRYLLVGNMNEMFLPSLRQILSNETRKVETVF